MTLYTNVMMQTTVFWGINVETKYVLGFFSFKIPTIFLLFLFLLLLLLLKNVQDHFLQ